MLVFVNGAREEKTEPPPARATSNAKNKRPAMKRAVHHPLDVIPDELMTRSQEQTK